jgi:phage terminase Nu1 subunit (DNA packaging protein)
MDELAEDLRATTESIAHDAQRLRDIEREKGTLDVDDPRLQELSAEGARLGERLADSTAVEEQLVHLAADPDQDRVDVQGAG